MQRHCSLICPALPRSPIQAAPAAPTRRYVWQPAWSLHTADLTPHYAAEEIMMKNVCKLLSVMFAALMLVGALALSSAPAQASHRRYTAIASV